MVLTLSVLLAFATPFGKYVGRGASNLAIAMGIVNNDAVDENNINEMGKEWEEYLGGDKLAGNIAIENCYSTSFSYSINAEDFDTVKIYKNGELFKTYSNAEGIANGLNICQFNAGDFKNGDTIIVELYKDSNLIGKNSGTYHYIETYAIVLDNSTNANDSAPMVFVRSNTPVVVGEQYTTEKYGAKTVLAAYTGFEDIVPTFDIDAGKSNLPWNASSSIITSITFIDKISPIATKGWFSNLVECHTYNLENLNTSTIKDMSYMFYNASSNVNVVDFNFNDVDVSSVTDMSYLFGNFASNSQTVKLDISKWDVRNVKTMECTFFCMGLSSTEFSLNLTGWDTESLESLYGNLYRTGDLAPNW